MPGLKDATRPRDTSKLKPIDTSASIQRPPIRASADPEFNPLAIAPIPPVLGTPVDSARQFYRNNVSQIRMPPLPTLSSPAVGAQVKSQVEPVSLVASVSAAALATPALAAIAASGTVDPTQTYFSVNNGSIPPTIV